MLPTNFNSNDKSSGGKNDVSSTSNYFVTPSKVTPSKKTVKLKKEKNWLLWGLATFGVIIVLSIVGLVIFGTISNEHEEVKTKKQVYGDIQSSDSQSSYTAQNFSEDEDEITDVKVEEIFEQEEWNKNGIEVALSHPGLKSSKNYSLIKSSVAALPSEEAGYTSNLNELLLEDGTYNPLFSYWTQEVFAKELTLIIEAFTNPLFGQWSASQDTLSKEAIDLEYFKNLYILESHDTLTVDDLPLFIDWSGNNFGAGEMLIEEGVPMFTPEIKSITNEFTFGDPITVDTRIDIIYHGKSIDGFDVEKKAVISLVLVENTRGDDYPRVLVKLGNIEVS